MPELTDLDALLEDAGGSGFSLIDPKVVEAGQMIATAFLQAGSDAWGVFLGRGVLFTEGSTDYQAPADALSDVENRQVLTAVDWKGERSGRLWFLVPELCAKGVVAYFLALAMGSEPDPENTALDAEGMDAYAEAINNFVVSGAAQALRQKLGGEIKLTVGETRVVDLNSEAPADLFGGEESLCHQGTLTIEGMMPATLHLLLPVSVTGLKAEIEERPVESAPAAGRSTAGFSGPHHAEEHPTRNLPVALKIKLPTIVELASKKMRMSEIQDLAPGSIIEFRKQSHEFLTVRAGALPFAEGEVVIINEHFGLQVRKVLDIRAQLTAHV